ncbi:MAG: GNAT family N-acetyltransferase [Candidatus Nanopelagicales bacterium]
MEMFRAMGIETSDATDWRAAALSWFADRVHRPDFGIFVIEVEGAIVAAGLGQVRDMAPSPTNPSGGDVLISNICTLPAHRRRGYGSAVFAATLEWARGTGVGRVELMATQPGRRMYEQAGFAETPWPAMRFTL